jgi:hypothetical protein
MKFRLRSFLLAALITVSCAVPSSAQMFGGRVIINRHTGPWQGNYHAWQPPWYAGPRRAPTYDEYYHYMNSRFPKYYGGLHANYFQSTGVSPGDIGPRGNGIFPSPW